MQAGEAAEPTVGDRDVLVDIHAAGVNLLDAKVRDGEFKLFLPYKAPFVLGHDLAGVVTRVGSAVTRFTVGDEVYGRPRDGRIGTFAERIAVHEDDLAIKPASLSMAEAASVPLVALTAWQALVERANLQPGQKVLIHAGSGGVGTYAIQLAKHLGATVATTTGTSNVEWVRDLGADVVIDYRTQDFETVVHDYDVVLDSQGGDTLAKSLRVLKPGGHRHRHRRPAGPGLRPPARTTPSAAAGDGPAQLEDAPSGTPPAAFGTRSSSCAPAVPSSTRSPSSSTQETSAPSSTGRTRSTRPRRPSPTSKAAGPRARSSSRWSDAQRVRLSCSSAHRPAQPVTGTTPPGLPFKDLVVRRSRWSEAPRETSAHAAVCAGRTTCRRPRPSLSTCLGQALSNTAAKPFRQRFAPQQATNF